MKNTTISRRNVLLAGGLLSAASSAFGTSGFWNKKQPSEWSAEEIEKLKTNSPWAKRTPLNLKTTQASKNLSMDSGGSKGTFGGMRGADSNGLSNGGGRGGGGAERKGTSEVTVRWESAKPMLGATKRILPPIFENSYAISVTGLPRAVLIVGLAGAGAASDPADRQKASIQRLLAGTTLTAKGYDPRVAAFVVQSNDLASLIFGFEKGASPFSLDDREIVFRMELDIASIQARFEPKEMIFNGYPAI